MKRMAVCILILVVGIGASMAEAEYQVFRDTQDREIEARILKYDPATNRVTVQLRSGKKSTADLSIFCEADQVRVKDWYLSEELLSDRNLIVTINKKTIQSDSYHAERDGWQSHYPGMNIEDVAFEISLNNRSRGSLKDIAVDYCIFYESRRKQRTGQSELQDISSGGSAWYTTSESSDDNKVVTLRRRGRFSVDVLESRAVSETLTDCVQLKDGSETNYGEETNKTRSYKTRKINEKISGIIMRISIPLSSGGFARKEYAYPSDFLTKETVNWNKSVEAQNLIADREVASSSTGNDETKIMAEIHALMKAGKFKEAEVLCRHLYDTGVERKYHGAWRLGNIYLSSENPDRNTELGVEWLIKAFDGGFTGPYIDLIEFYACDPDPAVRDGRKAVKYAALMMDRWGRSPSPGACKTAACAYACDGQFDKAVEYITQAISRIRERQGDYQYVIDEYEQILARFTQNQPWPN